MRAFLAIELPAFLRRRAAALRTREPVRWVAPEALHVTLRFLGDLPDALAPDLARALTPIADRCPPLTLALRGGGAFGPRVRPRVLWVGLAGDLAPLRALAADLERAVVELGLPPADRPFSPHLTLGRIRDGVPSEALAHLAEVGDLGAFEAREIVLFASDLRPGGALHTPVLRLPLRGGPSQGAGGA